jgi:hypothetical protein
VGQNRQEEATINIDKDITLREAFALLTPISPKGMPMAKGIPAVQ